MNSRTLELLSLEFTIQTECTKQIYTCHGIYLKVAARNRREHKHIQLVILGYVPYNKVSSYCTKSTNRNVEAHTYSTPNDNIKVRSVLLTFIYCVYSIYQSINYSVITLIDFLLQTGIVMVEK